MLGLFLLGIFSNIKNNLNAVIALVVGILVIMVLTVYPLLYPDREPLAHSYLIIVIGTLTIFLTGILLNYWKEKKKKT